MDKNTIKKIIYVAAIAIVCALSLLSKYIPAEINKPLTIGVFSVGLIAYIIYAAIHMKENKAVREREHSAKFAEIEANMERFDNDKRKRYLKLLRKNLAIDKKEMLELAQKYNVK